MNTVLRAREAVRRMKEYHPPLSGREGLRLDFNENTDAPSPRVAELLKRFASQVLTKYPERAPVEAAVADFLKRPNRYCSQMVSTRPSICSARPISSRMMK
jgi:histidinol-phosphate aminotransferase